MEWFWDFLKSPFAWGLGLGLALTFFTWKSALAAKHNLKKENRRLQDEMRDLEKHLNTQLKINASGNSSIEEKLDEMKQQNENLRITVSTLQNKPGRAELRSLHTMESAVRLMREQAPGFASAWEMALRQAEGEYEEASGGLRKLVRKVIALPNASEIEKKSDEKEESEEETEKTNAL